MADLLNVLVQETSGPPELITAAEARVLIGRGPTCVLRDLSGFPAPVTKAKRGAFAKTRQAMFRRGDVETWLAGYEDAMAATKARVAQNTRERAKQRATAEARSLIGLPSEFERNRSLMRDLFDEDQRTCAPAPCSRWAVLLRKAGHTADGRDISPTTLKAERRGDGRVARAAVTVGHHPDVVKPRPSNPGLSAPAKIVPSRVDYPRAEVVQAGA